MNRSIFQIWKINKLYNLNIKNKYNMGTGNELYNNFCKIVNYGKFKIKKINIFNKEYLEKINIKFNHSQIKIEHGNFYYYFSLLSKPKYLHKCIIVGKFIDVNGTEKIQYITGDCMLKIKKNIDTEIINKIDGHIFEKFYENNIIIGDDKLLNSLYKYIEYYNNNTIISFNNINSFKIISVFQDENFKVVYNSTKILMLEKHGIII
jgi:hypothetical protein